MDIATLLESHRQYMLELAQEPYGDGETLTPDEARGLTWAHDRATTKTLLDLYRQGNTGNGEVKPLGQAALTTPPPKPSHRVKAGSKAAKARALKAGETRRANLAAKAASMKAAVDDRCPEDSAPALSPATHLAPRTPEGGAA